MGGGSIAQEGKPSKGPLVRRRRSRHSAASPSRKPALPPPTTKARSTLQPADLQGVARLAVDATVGIVDLVERLHHTIARRTGIVGAPPAGATTGITGLVYRSVRGTTRLTGLGLDTVLSAAARRLPARPGTPGREAALAALNGVWGDHLEASANPLAIPMTLRHHGLALTLQRQALAAVFPQAGARVLVLVHGLCMNDLQWQRDGHDHGQALARSLDATPLYLHHNSGRHVSSNGHDLAALLETLLAQWPVPVEELILLGHSMGGLIIRSACHQAQAQGLSWPGRLRAIALLGTPHHGAPLERGGLLVDRLLGISPYGAPFVRLGASRSAGITDLRFGNLQHADWQGRGTQAQHHDDRQPTPLPEGVPCLLVAATTGERASGLRGRLIGDGLVSLDSALGRHRDPARTLPVPAANQRVITRANHWDLLSRPEVSDWLGERLTVLDQAG